jgi:phage baseplate assembly protein V
MNETNMDRLFMRLRGLFGRGRVTLVDDSGVVQQMQVAMSGLNCADDRYRVAEFGFTSSPPIGSDVLTLHVAGDISAGAVFATNHQQSRPTGLQAGESMLYSEDGKQVYMTASGGIVVNANGQDVVVNNAADVTWNLTGKLKIVAPGGVEFDSPTLTNTGDMQDNVGTNTQTMADSRETFDGHDHDIDEVQTGGSTVTSNKPNQQE